MIKFEEMKNPKWFSIDWTCAKSGTGFRMSASEVNGDGLDWIVSQARDRGISLNVSKSSDGKEYIFFVKESQLDIYNDIWYGLVAAGSEGVLFSDMKKKPPYSKFSVKKLKAALEDLEGRGSIESKIYVSPKGGRPTRRYIANK